MGCAGVEQGLAGVLQGFDMALVGDGRPLPGPGQGHDAALEFVQALARFGADGKLAEVVPGLEQVPLAAQDETILPRRKGQQPLILLRQGLGAVQEQDRHVRPIQSGAGTVDADLLHQIPALPDARRVHQPHGHAEEAGFLVQSVPGGAGQVRDDGPIRPQQGVQQGALAHVGPAHQGHVDPFPQGPSLPPLGDEGVDLPLRPIQALRQSRGNVLLHLVGIVHRRVDGGKTVDQQFFDAMYPLGQLAVELLQSRL